MSRRTTLSVVLAAVTALPVSAQPSPQFKASVRMKDGSDGSTSTGTMFFGGAKARTELAKDGKNVVILVDPSAKSQVVLMPSEKVYMQMPIGQGTVSVPITGPLDPTNPCGGASGNTDCVKGPNVSVNGYGTVQWDYTNAQGVRGRSWVSTALRFPVKAQDDNGSSMELSNIAEGPQAASLFGIPAGYKKMDMSAIGASGSAGRSSDAVAAAMSNMSPGAAAALARARRGEVPKGEVATAGTAWEKGNGWVLTLTITGTSTSTNPRATQGAIRETYTTKYVASIPLNYGTPGAGVAGAPGPMWTHLVGAGGSAAVLAKPLSISVDAESRADQTFAGNCAIGEDPFTAVTTMKNTAQRSSSMQQPSADGFTVQAVFKLSPDLKTYGLTASFLGFSSKESEQKRIDGKRCRTQQAYTKNETDSRDVDYGATIEINGLTLPSSVSAITGSKSMPMTLGGHQMDATVSWTLTPIR